MDKGENSAKNDKSTKTLGVKIKEEPQEETIKVGIIVFTPFIVEGFHLIVVGQFRCRRVWVQ